MIKQVSWADYWSVVAAVCAVYYLAIILLFYKKELIEIVSGKRRLFQTPAASATRSPQPAGHQSSPSDDVNITPEEKLFGLTNQLMQEINPVFGNEYVKGELMTALKTVLRKYTQLKGTAFQISVNNYIEMESENQCSVTLSEGELKELWHG
ncbi:MAG: hypothetical protein ABI675_02945 [Chitinophagaceae bacterium]